MINLQILPLDTFDSASGDRWLHWFLLEFYSNTYVPITTLYLPCETKGECVRILILDRIWINTVKFLAVYLPVIRSSHSKCIIKRLDKIDNRLDNIRSYFVKSFPYVVHVSYKRYNKLCYCVSLSSICYFVFTPNFMY